MLNRELVADKYCQGVNFSVHDRDALARAVALVLVQEFTLARDLITGKTSSGEAPVITLEEVEDIIDRRLKTKDVYHRDGFLFQLIMWLSAHLDAQDGDIIALPHSQGSAKGQDSVLVHRDKAAVVAVTICEDKATENPRDTIREEVWPEIVAYEKGGRRDELRSTIIQTLGTAGVSADDAVRLIRGISWEGRRRYRVRVTIDGKRGARLFKDFESIVIGEEEKRRGETLLLDDLRSWMTEFSSNVEEHLRRFLGGAEDGSDDGTEE